MRGDYGWTRSAGMAARRSVAGWLGLAVVAVLVVGVDPAFGALSPTPDRSYGTDGPVQAAVQSGNTIFLGGGFTTIGPPTEPGVVLPRTSGTPDAGWPSIDGPVTGVVGDGAGGWYIAGQFHRVGNLRRPGLAHILPDKSVDPTFNPLAVSFDGSTARLSEPQINTDGIGHTELVLIGSTLYTPTAATGGIQAIDARTGAQKASPVGIDGPILSMVSSGSTLFIGGTFQHVGGQPRAGIAAIDGDTGSVTGWNPGVSAAPAASGTSPTGSVYSLAVHAGTVYVAGSFVSLGGQSRPGLGAVGADGVVTSWMPHLAATPNSEVVSIGVSDSALYSWGGVGPSDFKAFSLSDGSQTAWSPSFTGTGPGGITLLADGSTVYIGSGGNLLGSTDGKYYSGLFAVDATTGAPQPWSPIVDGDALALAAGSSGTFVGGHFNSVGGVVRHGLAAIDATTGRPLGFDAAGGVGSAGPGNYAGVYALALSGSTLYVGGHFDHLGAAARDSLGAVDTGTGAVTNWKPSIGATGAGQVPSVASMSLNGSTLYFAGNFASAGGAAHGSVAAVRTSDASVTPWNPGLGGIGQLGSLSLASSASAVYIAGQFATVGGQSISNLAAVNTTDGAPLAGWNPSPNAPVRSVALSGPTLYVSGYFSSIGGQSRARIAALDATSGAVGPWRPLRLDNSPRIVVDGSNVFTGGGQIDAVTGAYDPWRPEDPGYPLLVTPTKQLLNEAPGGSDRYSPLTSAPTALTGAELIGAPLPTGALACNPAVFDGAYTTTYQWLRDGTPIHGATGQSYVINSSGIGGATPDNGHALSCRVTGTNPLGSTDVTSATLTVASTSGPPVNSTVPTVTGGDLPGGTLSCFQGSWAGEMPQTYAYAWLRDGTTIQSGTSSDYAVTSTDVGHGIVCRVTAQNGAGSASADSASTTIYDPNHTCPDGSRIPVGQPCPAGPLVANAGDDQAANTGETVRLDGSASQPSGGIGRYHWDFGDGGSADGAVVTHQYASPGSYTAKLTITQSGGTATASATATIKVSALTPNALTVTVRSGGTPLPGVDVLAYDADGTKHAGVTDSSGKAILTGLPDGNHRVLAYAPNYVPAAATATVTSGTGAVTIDLTPGSAVAAQVTTRRLTHDEIVARGIDPNDPANQNVYLFTIHLPTGDVSGCTNGTTFYASCGYTPDSNGPVNVAVTTVRGVPTLATFVVPGKATFLKEFFEVQLTITNLATPDFTLSHGSATLRLPTGLSLASTNTPQSAVRPMPDIVGGQSATTDWTVRGDAEGDYTLTGSYDATLDPFGAPVSISATNRPPLKIYGGSAVKLVVDTDNAARDRYPFEVRVGLKNVSDGPVYEPTLDLTKAGRQHYIEQPLQSEHAQADVIAPGATFWAPPYILVPDASGSIDVSKAFVETVRGDTNLNSTITTHARSLTFDQTPGLRGIRRADGAIVLDWDPVAGATAYKLFRTPDRLTDFPGTPVATQAVSATSAVVPASDVAAEGQGTREYAISSLINGVWTMVHPLLGEASIATPPPLPPGPGPGPGPGPLPPPGGGRYVALGDSYSSGEGVEPFFPGTYAEGVNVCHRSTLAYSQLLDAVKLQRAAGDANSRAFVACSGAITDDLYKNNHARNAGEGPQLNAVESQSTRLATISLGGNDVDFGGILTDCINGVVPNINIKHHVVQLYYKGSGCRHREEQGFETKIGMLDGTVRGNRRNGSVHRLSTVYTDIMSRMAPKGRLLVVNYPSALGQPKHSLFGGYKRCVVGSLGYPFYFDGADVAWMAEKVAQVDLVIRREVARARSLVAHAGGTQTIRVVDAATPFEGHGICDSPKPEQRWFNPLILDLNSTNPGPSPYSFHPNVTGQRMLAHAVNAVLP